MRDAFCFLLPLSFLWCACIPTAAVLPVARGTLEAQVDIVSALDELDALCQARATTEPQLLSCRVPRDRGLAALRRQAALWQVTK
jgi:hypothetical protein